MSSIAISKRLISSEEYHKMGEIGLIQPDERVELINGEINTRAPIGTRHFASVNKLNVLFVPVFVDQYIVSIQNCIHIDKWNEPEPDVVILKKDKEEYSKVLPGPEDVLIVIEVSDTTYSVDKNVKLPLYASADIPIYWIVNLPENRIEIYSDPVKDVYKNCTIYNPGEQVPMLAKTFEVSEILITS